VSYKRAGAALEAPAPAGAEAIDPGQFGSQPNSKAFIKVKEEQPAGGEKPAGKGADVEAPVQRKIIYTGYIDLIVTDFDDAGKKLQKLVQDSNGYIAKSDVGILTGERRRASWTLRIPTANFQSAMDAIAQLGYATSTRHDSQDITDEYYDLEARLKNKQVEEKRLLEHLQKSTGKLEDILAVEKELTRVRGEIELAQGRLQKLSKLSEMTTITVSMQERKDYTPPTAPTYTSTLGRTMGESFDALVNLFRGLTLVIAALIPWSPFLALLIGVPWWLIRRRRRSLLTARESIPKPPPAAAAPAVE
jgi:hypothetical protein